MGHQGRNPRMIPVRTIPSKIAQVTGAQTFLKGACGTGPAAAAGLRPWGAWNPEAPQLAAAAWGAFTHNDIRGLRIRIIVAGGRLACRMQR